MFGRILLIVLSVISLLWLGYATYDRVNQGKQYSPEYLFGSEDESLLIVLNPVQAPVATGQFGIENETISALIANLNLNLIDDIYVSKKRGHVLIRTKEVISSESVSNLFMDQSVVKTGKKGSISYGKLEGKYSKNNLYLYSGSFDLNKHPWEDLHFDKNCDASIIAFKHGGPSVTDMYIKENGVIEYKAAAGDEFFGTKVNDKEVFASIVPASVQSYQFYETEYLRNKEPELLESPMNNWLKYGLVHVVINNQEAIITDYIEGQEPIQVLYDFYKKESTDAENDYFEKAKLTQLLKESNGLYVYQADDFVVISGNRAICETIIGDYKLGNTLAQNAEKSHEIYGKLPQKVNFRKVSNTEKTAVSVYDNVLLSTVVGGTPQTNATTAGTNTSTTASFVVGSIAKDILVVDEHHFFVTTNDNKVIFFEKGKKKWEQALDGSIIGDAAIIDIYANEKTQLLVSTSKKVYVLDINGNQPNGFPIDLDDQANIQTPLFYRWKGSGFFVLAGQNGRLLQYDNQGRELAIIRTQLNDIEQPPVVWVSANKPFIGIYGNGRFEMIQAESRKPLRIFDAKDITTALKLPNEVKLFGVSNNQLVSFDQKGGITRYEKFINGKLVPTLYPDKGIVVKDQQQLKLFNSGGIQWGTIKLPFSDVSDVQLFSTANGTTIIATIDALENRVYLWKSNGELYNKQQWDGSKIVRYHNGYLFTVVDNLVVRYALK